ncbi:hypothetical protein SAMCCGM7_pC0857 (plasmid) [Sinorhizobium americanum CCGM7]|uniref:hypothetical protein n=1 Tax=Sinorhizobium americanum TaxID=194963 RepID=UPI0004DA082F|nr:hypothetical protein [Sinorhizobium americanum]APG88055.1 hypothetical protein SAMCCGM7_pC0857 [Sinorhizobium americanum CCGM7]
MSKKTPDPSDKAVVEEERAVAAAVDLAMKVYRCDAKTAAAHRALEAWMEKREGEFTFWLYVFHTVKPHSGPGCVHPNPA